MSGPHLVPLVASYVAIATVIVALRCYVRIHVRPCFDLDDALAIASLEFFILYSAFIIVAVQHGGIGQNIKSLSPTTIEIGLKYLLILELMYGIATTLVKVSICMSLLRFATKPAMRVTLYIVIALVTSFTIALGFLTLFQCVPVSKFWTRVIEITPPGTCLDPNTVVAVAYTHSAIVTVVDWTLAIFPIIIVWNIHISLNTKIFLALLLGLGSVSCIATIVRFPYIYILRSINTIFENMNLAAWSVIEVGTAIIACSVAALRPLIHKMTTAYEYEMHRLQRCWTGST